MSRIPSHSETTYSKDLAGVFFIVGLTAIAAPLAIAQASDPRLFFETLFSLGRLASCLIPTGIVLGGMGLAMWRSNRN